MASSQVESIRARAMWLRCLASAFRTALACIIVGVATLYGPESITKQVAFPAFSYVTVILIVTDATLGHTFRCCWLAVVATVQAVCPAILSLWLIGPERLSASTTAAVLAISAFIVVLPGNTHLVTKRIALGQLVIVYVIGYINGERTEPIMHPIHVAASTALGVVACVLALLFPYPSLAFYEVKENCRLYLENSSKRLNLFMKCFSAEEMKLHKALISQATSLDIAGRKLLHNIKSKQESMQWEILPIRLFKSYNTNPGERLQALETVLTGMEIALTNFSELPVSVMSPELKNDLSVVEDKILNQVKSMTLENAILPQTDTENKPEFLQTLQINNTLTVKDLPSLFFVFCLKLLQPKSKAGSATVSHKPGPKDDADKDKFLSNVWTYVPGKGRLMPALKLSLSLGFAVLLGLIYSKENGFWAGLPVAISLASSREATFKVANIKAQGTVLGTVYGVVGCFVFERYVKIRFVSLLPWFIFCAFLRQSKMYGQAGGISAVIGAVLILGRKNFGTPSDFAIARIVETFIGLSCSIMVDMLLQPTRASVLAKGKLSMSLKALHESVRSMTLSSRDRAEFEQSRNKLQFQVNELGKFIEEAELEPNFWYLPFHSACYTKLKGSLSKTADLLLFQSHALRFLEQESRKMECKMWKEAFVKLDADLKLLRDAVCSGIKCFHEVSLIKSVAVLEKEYEKRNDSVDLEMGKCGAPRQGGATTQWSKMDVGDEMERSTSSFLQHMEEVMSGVERDEVNMELVLSLSAVVFCMNGIVRESKEIEKAMKELVQWENPSSQVDLHGISCKIDALAKSVTIQLIQVHDD